MTPPSEGMLASDITTAELTTGEILSISAARHPDRTAIKADGRSQTYGELDLAANRVANALVDAGIGKGDRAAILSANHFDYPAIYFGAARTGCILTHMSVRYTVDDLIHVIAKSKIRLMFVHVDLWELAAKAAASSPELERLVLFGDPDKTAIVDNNAVRLEQFLEGAKSSPPAVKINSTDPYAITYTGGTTGFPKAVLVTHQRRLLSTLAAEREFGVRGDDIVLCTTPLFHVAGLYVWFQTAIKLGCTLVFMEKWSPDAFLTAVERHGITATFLVPTQINGVLNDPDFRRERLASLRYINFSGAPTTPASLERMLKTLPDIVMVEHYGQSEACPLTVRPPEFNASKAGSVGRAMQGVEMSVLDQEGHELPAGEVGEIATRGPHVLLKYDGDPGLTAELFTPEGWLKTGDVGFIDEDGFLFLVDRSKDMIISGAENIYPTEIENALYKHPSVRECAVFGIPDDHWGELPAAHVVLAPGETVEEDALIAFTADHIPRHKRPRLIRIVDELPKTAVGKIQKNVIRAPYWGKDVA
jgi:fatty-acyl-CoA synthase